LLTQLTLIEAAIISIILTLVVSLAAGCGAGTDSGGCYARTTPADFIVAIIYLTLQEETTIDIHAKFDDDNSISTANVELSDLGKAFEFACHNSVFSLVLRNP